MFVFYELLAMLFVLISVFHGRRFLKGLVIIDYGLTWGTEATQKPTGSCVYGWTCQWCVYTCAYFS